MRSLIIILLALSLTANIAIAQNEYRIWEPFNGPALRMGSHIEMNRSVTVRNEGNNIGESAMAWSDTRLGDRNIYVQVFDIDGEPRFNDNGLLINGADRVQMAPVIAPASDGGWFVAWVDFFADSLGEVTITKINERGDILWGNIVEGIHPTAHILAVSVQRQIKLLSDGNEGCYIAWEDSRNGDPSDIYAMHLQSNGERDVEWPEDGLALAQQQFTQSHVRLVADGEGGFIATWLTNDNNWYDIVSQRIDRAGNSQWNNGEGVVICDGFAYGSESLNSVSDGDGGAFIAWIDLRNREQTRNDIWAQRIDSEGHTYWADNGLMVCDAPQDQENLMMVEGHQGEAILVWEDYRADAQQRDIYAMKIGGFEQFEKRWDPARGVMIVDERFGQFDARVSSDRDGGAFILWSDERNGRFPDVDIFAQHIDSDGEAIWAVDGVPVAVDPGWQYPQSITSSQNGMALAIWSTNANGNGNLTGQLLDGEGSPLWPDEGLALVKGFGGNAYPSSLFRNPDGSLTACWSDGRGTFSGAVPYIQTFYDEAGQFASRFDYQGIPVITGAAGFNPVACSDGENGTIIAMEFIVGGLYEINAQRISHEGEQLWSETGMLVAPGNTEQFNSSICPDENGGAYICWVQETPDGNWDPFIQHISPDGERLWGNEGLSVVRTETEEVARAVFPDGEGGVVVFWERGLINPESWDWQYDIMAERFNSEGIRLWGVGGEGIAVVDDDGNQNSPAIAAHPDGWVVAWEDDREDFGDNVPGIDIYAQFIGRDGVLRWLDGGSIIAGCNGYQANPKLDVDDQGFIWAAWEDWRNGEGANGMDIYIQKLDPEPDNFGNAQGYFSTPDVPGSQYGQLLADVRGNQFRPSLTADRNGGMWVVWEDYRNAMWGDLYSIHLRADGTPFEGWEDNGNILCDAYFRQGGVMIELLSADGTSGIVSVWHDGRATGEEELTNVFCQRIDDDAVSVRHEASAVAPTNLVIENAYPNPFNSKSIVKYAVPNADRYTLKLIEITGREVAVLSDGWQKAGQYKLEIDGTALASGTYRLVLQSSRGRVEKSLLLIK